jgi:hypothetical protein
LDLLTILLFVVLVFGTFILRIVLLGWHGRRIAKKIIIQFGDAGAIIPERARSLEEVGLRLRSPSIGLRDHRRAVLQQFIGSGILLSTEDGRYYLSPEAYQFYNVHRST